MKPGDRSPIRMAKPRICTTDSSVRSRSGSASVLGVIAVKLCKRPRHHEQQTYHDLVSRAQVLSVPEDLPALREAQRALQPTC